jgi:hypothetical protein
LKKTSNEFTFPKTDLRATKPREKMPDLLAHMKFNKIQDSELLFRKSMQTSPMRAPLEIDTRNTKIKTGSKRVNSVEVSNDFRDFKEVKEQKSKELAIPNYNVKSKF